MRFASIARSGLLVTLPLTSLLSACGGGGSDKKVALDDWVDDLCDAAADFQKASDKAGEDFFDIDPDDTKAAKKAFADSVKGVKAAQKDFRSDFGKIGQPDIEGGDKVVDAFEDQFDENDKFTDKVAKAVADIDDDDDFTEGFFGLLDKYDSPEFRPKLDDLAEDNDEVQDLIDAIDDDSDCADTIFDSDSAASDTPATPSASKTTTTSSARTPTPPPANTPNEKFVAGVCSSFSGWVNDLVSANEKFQTELDKSSGDGPAIKKLLVDFLKLGQTETKNLQKEMTALKAPDVKDGAKIQKVFVDTAAKLVTVFDGLVSDANKISTSSPSQTLADVTRLSDGIGRAFDEAAAGFDELDDFDAPELDKLFDNRPECAGF